MIVHLSKTIPEAELRKMALDLKAIRFEQPERHVLVTSSYLKTLNGQHNQYVEATFAFENDIQLSNRAYLSDRREIKLGNLSVGGSSSNLLLIGGPCAVESEEQIDASASMMHSLGLSTMRAGCFKPRTSPYTFQGLGSEGLRLLSKMRDKYGLNIITEVRDHTHVDEVIATTDIIQVGAKAMYDQSVLKACGKASKPVLLKRGFGTNLQEFVQAAEFILSGGNQQVILCERGIRTFETKTRFTLDLCGVAWLQEHTNLPVVVDPSHALGYRYGIKSLAMAATAMQVDGLLIESHPQPTKALSDAAQQLNFDEFADLYEGVAKITNALDLKII